MEEIIKQAIEQEMKPNIIEDLMFLNHIIGQMIELEKLLSE